MNDWNEMAKRMNDWKEMAQTAQMQQSAISYPDAKLPMKSMDERAMVMVGKLEMAIGALERIQGKYKGVNEPEERPAMGLAQSLDIATNLAGVLCEATAELERMIGRL